MTLPVHDVSMAELARRMDDLSKGVREDLGEIIRRMDGFVLREVYASDARATVERLNAMDRAMLEHRTNAERRADAQDRRMDAQEAARKSLARWLISAVFLPLLGLLITVALAFNAFTP